MCSLKQDVGRRSFTRVGQAKRAVDILAGIYIVHRRVAGVQWPRGGAPCFLISRGLHHRNPNRKRGAFQMTFSLTLRVTMPLQSDRRLDLSLLQHPLNCTTA